MLWLIHVFRYKPDGTPECYPAADLSGTSAAYTAGTNSTPASVTLNFAEHDVRHRMTLL